MNVGTEELHNPAHEQSQQEQLEQLLKNLENQDQEDQEDQHDCITTSTMQAMSKMNIKSNDYDDLIQDPNMSSDDSGSSYRVPEAMYSMPGTPDNLSTRGAQLFLRNFWQVANILKMTT